MVILQIRRFLLYRLESFYFTYYKLSTLQIITYIHKPMIMEPIMGRISGQKLLTKLLTKLLKCKVAELLDIYGRRRKY
jgi:hypothetical protein